MCGKRWAGFAWRAHLLPVNPRQNVAGLHAPPVRRTAARNFDHDEAPGCKLPERDSDARSGGLRGMLHARESTAFSAAVARRLKQSLRVPCSEVL
jgi:hypothetical protein